jgi:hypothetical protein
MVSFAEAFAGRKMSKAAIGNARSACRGPHREAGGSLAELSDAEVDRRMGQQLQLQNVFLPMSCKECKVNMLELKNKRRNG